MRNLIDAPLTDAQTRVLEFIKRHIAEEGFPPTRAEIASAFGFSSANSAQEHLVALQRHGKLFLRRGTARGISVA